MPLVTVNVDVGSRGRTIPADFDGFSIEVTDAAEKYLGVAGSPNTVFEQLLRNLGKAVIRIGGNSTDFSCWHPGSAPYPQGCAFTLTPRVLDGYMQASARTGWSLIAGVNLAQNSATWASAYGSALAAAASRTPGSSLIGFEFGNEPDLYSSSVLFDHHLIRPKGYSWPNLVADWKPYVTAFKGQASTSKFALAGPAYDDSSDVWRDSYLKPWLQRVGAKNLGLLSVHEYPTYTCGGHHVTIAQLLASQLITTYAQMAAGWQEVAKQSGLPLELGETNSTACGGQDGVDNVFAATAWGLDWLFTNGQLGIQGINYHMDDACYSAVFVDRKMQGGKIVYSNSVAPLYYAMYAFNTAAEGSSLLRTVTTSRANVKAYAVRSAARYVRVFVINKDLHAVGQVSVHLTSRMGDGSLLRIAAPGLASKNVSYGGTTFDNATGRLRGAPKTTPVAPDAHGDYDFMLGTATIAILTIR